MKKMAKEFKEFISRGNVMDMAIGIVIGGAFTAIINSLVNDILMPAIGVLCNTTSLADLSVKFTVPSLGLDGVTDAEVVLRYGAFLAAVINFLIVALTLFVIVRAAMKFQKKMESLKKKDEEPPKEEAPKEPTTEEKTLEVLGEIKALLEKK